MEAVIKKKQRLSNGFWSMYLSDTLSRLESDFEILRINFSTLIFWHTFQKD